MSASHHTLMLGTRKGLIRFEKGANGWKYHNTCFLGIPVSMTHRDDRSGIWWACLDHGHWGTKLHRSSDEGKSWEEVAAPKFPEGYEVKEGVPASVRYLWAFAQGGADQPGRIYIGTEPGGLFQSDDNGDSFQLVESLWNHPSRAEHWFGGGRDYAGIHSIAVDPRDSDHFFVGVSVAGVFETRDGGKSWQVRNKGLRADFLPDPHAELSHDPHLLVMSRNHPEMLWQQNHCGIFRSTDGGQHWHDVSQPEGPARFGFCIETDSAHPERAWVVPAISDEIRAAIGQSLCVSRTEDGGKTWTDFRAGLPQEGCFDIVYRHALARSGNTLAFGTTTGNLFLSENDGVSWTCLNHTLPMVYSVDFV